jgi:hypothetical protein
VICSADACASAGFCATTAAAYATAASRQGSTPEVLVGSSVRVAKPITSAPANAIAHPEHERPREALVQHDARQHGDEDRPDVDEHRRRARVDVALALVQRGGVDGRNRCGGGFGGHRYDEETSARAEM